MLHQKKKAARHVILHLSVCPSYQLLKSGHCVLFSAIISYLALQIKNGMRTTPVINLLTTGNVENITSIINMVISTGKPLHTAENCQ